MFFVAGEIGVYAIPGCTRGGIRHHSLITEQAINKGGLPDIRTSEQRELVDRARVVGDQDVRHQHELSR